MAQSAANIMIGEQYVLVSIHEMPPDSQEEDNPIEDR